MASTVAGNVTRSTKTGSTVATVATWVIGLIFFFPVLWMVVTAFKQEVDASTDTPKVLFTPTLDQFREVFASGFWPYVANSVFATIVSTLLVLALAVPASYALAIRPVKRTQDVLFFFISTKMLPVVAVIVPLYIIAQGIQMLDHIWFLIILFTAMNLPIAVWMLRSFMIEVPAEVLEAAQVDGAALLPSFRHVLLPMIAPGIAATALICVIFAWNEFFFSFIITAARAGTVPVFLVGFITSEGLFFAQLSAAATMAALPVVIAGWVAQKQLVRGLSMGAIK
ncbi:MAG: Various polyols ABC transporter, permease protein 2 [uncultured Nocardioidaceae bacterium]|uniref:Various polyols ABC transporter, permease protein 2 n=1 Tax=uncultured Nocardioidaceae bacterium TaxID=253824 RepID=A0A6J4L9U9_9ACTN|nr:MAG: Various polyols ABC transporter, permease protein 2 [uncultured Nocardioidaceae bacterium]